MKKWINVLIIELILLLSLTAYNNPIFLSFLFIMIHEVVHIITALNFGCRLKKTFIWIFGANAVISDINELSEDQKLYLYLSGPLSNIFIGIICMMLFSENMNDLFLECAKINLFLGVFNLVPSYPLDGSKVLEVLLSRKVLYKKAQNIIEILSFIFCIVLFLVFLIITFLLHKINISLFIMVIFILYTIISERRKKMYIMMGGIVSKIRKIKRNGYVENKTISVYYKITLLKVLMLVDKNKFNIFYILNDDMIVLYIMNEDELISALKDYGNISLEKYILEKNK
ncbi:site-2 protease family protein [Clostridium sp. BJN0001]|uniref:site-2 protease family protein n=1 Tax=Clostridium sp. BJN0001 TaxID=2930219 RepID=UPI001FCFEE78|nr:site-2 protease family protein [Clostridium sp. BJN0001]